MKLECEVVSKTSKAGNPYNVLRVVICESPKVVKDFYLEDSDVALLQLTN